ncbi:MAG: GNAT family N-acetyltransferase [Ardenticatenaceae bacterium]|nr:GNAT family N-acetyltransferase [Ardenticatenaceae bacterium]
MPVSLRKIDDTNRTAVLALRVAPEQEQFVGGTVHNALADAQAYPHANPWFRAIYAEDVLVGFVMLSWNVVPDPPVIIGPWFLWKLLIDTRYQRKGYGQTAVRLIADIVRAEGGTELFTSYVEGEGEPWPFYQRLGFRKNGERDNNNEQILVLKL